MTEYEQYPDPDLPGYDPTMGGYLENASPDLSPPPPRPNYEHQPAFADIAEVPPRFNEVAYGSHPGQAPGYEQPGYDAPGYEQPAYQQPGYEQPGYDAPLGEVPEWEAPTYAADPGGQQSWGETPDDGYDGWGGPEGGEVTHEETANYPSHVPISVETETWDGSSWDLPEDDHLPEAALASTKHKISPSLYFIGFLCLAIIGIAAAAFFAFKVADKDPAGPATPEEAVASILEALAAEDALGVAESILPSERESLIDPTLALVDELTRIGLITDDTDLNKVGGVDITTDGLTMEIEETDDDIRWVTLNGGTIEITGSAGDLPMSDVSVNGDFENAIDFSTDPISFAVVSEGGSWYPSIWYTVAETARREADLPRPAISRKPIGSRSPQEAVARFIDAGFDMRPSEMLTSMDPLEMRAAYDYSSLFLADLDSAALEMRRDMRSDGSTWKLASLDTSVQESGNRAIVAIDGFVLTGTQGLTEPFTISLDGDCIRADIAKETQNLCRGSAGFPDVALQLRVVKRDGSWFVSGAPNLIYPYVDFLRTIETGSVDSFENLVAGLIDSAMTSADFTLAPAAPEPTEIWSTVFTVDSTIPAGTAASDLAQYLVSEELPSGFAPPDAIVNLGQVAGMSAIAEIPEGTVLTGSLFQPTPTDVIDPEVVDPESPTPSTTPSIAEPVEAELFPASAQWIRVDSAKSAVFDINPDAGEPLWVAERVDGSAIIQVTKLANSRETRALKFSPFAGWQKARNIEYPAYANSEYAVVVVGNYLVVSLDPLDDSGILLDQARYLGKQIR